MKYIKCNAFTTARIILHFISLALFILRHLCPQKYTTLALISFLFSFKVLKTSRCVLSLPQRTNCLKLLISAAYHLSIWKQQAHHANFSVEARDQKLHVFAVKFLIQNFVQTRKFYSYSKPEVLSHF